MVDPTPARKSASRARPASWLKDLPIGAAFLDRELRVTAANPALGRMLDRKPSRLRGCAWSEFEAEGDQLAPRLRELLAGERTELRCEVRCRRGPAEAFWAQITASKLVGGGRGSGPRLLLLVEDVDLRKQDDSRLRASERQYRVLFEKNLAGVYRSSMAGRILDCNEAFASMFGFASRQEALNSRAQDFYLAPEHRERWLGLLRDRGALSSFEACLRRKDGQPVWVLASEVLLPVADGQPPVIQGTMIDISARKNSEEQLCQERDFVSAVVDSAGMLVLVFDPNGTLLRFSKGAEVVTGFSAAALAGRSYWEFLLPPERHPQARRFLQDLQAGFRPNRLELDCCTSSGKTRRVTWSFSYLTKETGELAHVVATGVDITEHRRLEAQLRQAQKMEAIGQLAGGIAHDFNNLLTIITGHCDLMLNQPAGAGTATLVSERTHKIKAAADRAVALTRQLLTFSRTQAVEPRPVNLNEVVARSQEMLRPLLGEQVSMRSVLAENLEPVHADPVQLDQILMNLAINGRDAMPGGGTLLIETANIELDSAYCRLRPVVKPGAYVLLAVSDTGMGMDAATQARIFEPFFTTKERGRGTGLGLATAYGIVEQSDGYIWVYSEVGRGTTFKIYLPQRGRPAHAMPVPDSPSRGREAPSTGSTILLVDDDVEVRQLARDLLEAHGHHVLEAGGGAQALQLAEAAREPIHLLLTDAVMPDMSGRELAGRIRCLHNGLKVLYTSGFTGHAVAGHGLLDEGGSFIPKPFSGAALLRQVSAALVGG